MKLFFVIFAVLMVTVYPLKTDDSAKDIKQSPDYTSINRKNRASVVLISRHIARREGRKAVEKLLQGARETSSSSNSKYFQKHGNFETAIKDFKSLTPDDVMELEDNAITGTFIVEGTVGDRLLQVKQRGIRGSPSIEIQQMHVKSNNPFYMNYIISYVD